jgi:plasmid maintenance system antidote protein VapI
MDKQQKSQVIEVVSIDNRPFPLVHENIPIKDVEYDEENPRVKYTLLLQQMNGGKKKSMDEVMLEFADIKALAKDIEQNGGLLERVIVQPHGHRMKTKEGNRRLAAYRFLHAKSPDDERWQSIPARVAPKDADSRQIAIMLAHFHVVGKRQWDPHEKAAHIYDLVKKFGMSQDEIATVLHVSKTTVNNLLAAYSLMFDRFLTVDDCKYLKQGEKRWSYFLEFQKSKDLRAESKKKPDFVEDFCRWVGENRIPEGADVRRLSSILRHADAREKFEKGLPFDKAIKMVETAEPEQGSDFFKLLAKVRDSCTNVAQVREILRIRSDANARKRVLDTYTALVDFMRLADVEVPEQQ